MPGAVDVVERAQRALAAGQLVVVPTDTVYGIGGRADLAPTTSQIFEVKGRGGDTPLPVLVASWERAREVGRFVPGAEAIARLVWPGAVTLVVPRATGSRDWEIGGDGASIGLRIPDHPVTRRILQGSGPLAVSSANRSGEEPPRSCERIRSMFGARIAVYVCDDPSEQRRASTVVDLTGPDPRILRDGDAGAGDIARWREVWNAAR
jgi:L-threonylcarbamoyladenylate synthase